MARIEPRPGCKCGNCGAVEAIVYPKDVRPNWYKIGYEEARAGLACNPPVWSRGDNRGDNIVLKEDQDFYNLGWDDGRGEKELLA